MGGSPDANQITASTQAQLTKSLDGAEAVAAQYPKYPQDIIDAVRKSFLQSDQ